MSEKTLIERAMIAHQRTGGLDQPSSASDERVVDGKTYAVLRNTNGVLAVYEQRNDGILRKVDTWPAELNDK